MALAVAESRHPDELRADFQQYYGLNVDGMGVDFSHAHAAALVAQLPQASRVSTAQNPDAAWDERTVLLHSINYTLKVISWRLSKDGEKGRNAPRPPKTPSQRKRERERVEGADLDLVRRVLEGGG